MVALVWKVGVVLMSLKARYGSSLLWDHVRCSTDGEPSVPEGSVPDIGRFPWLGVVQHSFDIGGKTQYAVTGAVVVHPAFAVGSAEDIAKIHPEQMINNTKLILWRSSEEQFAVNVVDYMLHPDYQEQITLVSIALLQLVSSEGMGTSYTGAPVLPICMPTSGTLTLDQLFAVKMADYTGEMEKEVRKVTFVDDQDCDRFYDSAGLTFAKLSPKSAICTVSLEQDQPCVWDAGAALITRQNWGFWTFLGFGVRGPGCGAPAKFLIIHDYMQWITTVIQNVPLEDDQDEDTHKLMLRQISPVQIIMYKSTVKLPTDQGQCDRKLRGSVIYNQHDEVTVNKNFAQGFFFTEIEDIATFSCAMVRLEVASRTNAAVWLEHSCHRDMTGIHGGQAAAHERHNLRRQECFLYFKTSAFLKFRFYFSFKAGIAVKMYGQRETDRRIPNPNPSSEGTYPWWPTDHLIKPDFFHPYGRHEWNL